MTIISPQQLKVFSCLVNHILFIKCWVRCNQRFNYFYFCVSYVALNHLTLCLRHTITVAVLLGYFFLVVVCFAHTLPFFYTLLTSVILTFFCWHKSTPCSISFCSCGDRYIRHTHTSNKTHSFYSIYSASSSSLWASN